MKRVHKGFKRVVDDYLESIKKNWFSRCGEEDHNRKYKEKIFSIFRTIPPEERAEYICFIFFNMCKPIEDERCTNWVRQLAFDLATELLLIPFDMEKIIDEEFKRAVRGYSDAIFWFCTSEAAAMIVNSRREKVIASFKTKPKQKRKYYLLFLSEALGKPIDKKKFGRPGAVCKKVNADRRYKTQKLLEELGRL